MLRHFIVYAQVRLFCVECLPITQLGLQSYQYIYQRVSPNYYNATFENACIGMGDGIMTLDQITHFL